MKTIPPTLAAHMAKGTTTLCRCWKVTLTNGVIYGFTNRDLDVVVQGVTYQASSGFDPTDLMGQTRLAVDNLEAAGILDGNQINAADLVAGLWDYAAVEVFQVNFADPSMGIDLLFKGKIGRISQEQGTYKAELRGLSNAYQQTIGEIYQPGCRASLGDSRCKVNLVALTVTGTLTGVSADALTLHDTSRTEPGPTGSATGYFDYGKITMTSGASAGLSMEIKSYTVGTLTLQLQLSRGVAIGDTYELVPGCGKRFAEDCVTRFDNAVNFRGEPHLPGIDKILRVGGT